MTGIFLAEEMAAAAGLPLVGENKDPSRTGTYGVGQLIAHAIRQGAKKLILGLGGSATNDGGCGAAAALGAVFTDETGELFNLELGDSKGISAYRTQNQIILLTDSGNFVRYDLKGSRLGEIAGYQYSSFFSNVSHDFDPGKITWTELTDGDIFVNVYQSGNLIDTGNWDVRGWVPNCLTYDAEADRFVTLGTDPDTGERRFGMYGRYTLEQLKAMAQKALNGYELTQEQMEQYGIS